MSATRTADRKLCFECRRSIELLDSICPFCHLPQPDIGPLVQSSAEPFGRMSFVAIALGILGFLALPVFFAPLGIVSAWFGYIRLERGWKIALLAAIVGLVGGFAFHFWLGEHVWI